MTTGALIFAYNNEAFDYVRMAAWAAGNIKRHLGIPVAVVTDRPTNQDFDQVIVHEVTHSDERWFVDADRRVSWHNHSRADAWDLSPWDRTLLIDADYVVASDRLRTVIDHSTVGVVCHRHAIDITGMNDFHALNRLGIHDIALAWATVMIFDRSLHARLVFQSMKMVRDNWSHYQRIYQDRGRNYRNDHALTIALGITHGHTTAIEQIPWSLASVMPKHKLSRLAQDRYRVDFVRSDNRPAWIEIAGHDFHAMGKQSLTGIIS